ncbi:MAG TPA: hypothetical protein VNJ29_01730 [Candidatus Nitrosotenuis sp.]|nr:hypothetical protein [Candidatus Nitrosotenuis sp.]
MAKRPSDNFIKKTIEVWQPDSSSTLTPEDAVTIIQNVAAFIDLLAEWEAKKIKRLAENKEGRKNKKNIIDH